jgi:hypothetical protein
VSPRKPDPGVSVAFGKAQPLRTATAQIWLEENGIVHLEPLARREQGLNDAIENVNGVRETAAGVRRPLLVHFQQAAAQTPECRAHYTSAAAAQHITACAIVTSSVLGRVIGNLMIGMSKTNLPLRLFDTIEAAEKWLLEARQAERPPPSKRPAPGLR